MDQIYIPLLVGILIVSVIITAILIIIRIVKEKRSFTMKDLWNTYLYLISLISLMIMLYGGSLTVKSLLANLISPQFSYQTYEYIKPAYQDIKDSGGYDLKNDKDQTFFTENGKEYYYNNAEIKNNFIDGLTMFIALAIIFAVHRILSIKSDKQKDSLMRKVYNFTALAQYSVVSIIIIPVTIYSFIKYFTINPDLSSYSRTIPGVALSLFIFVVPTWIIFLIRQFKENRK